MFWVVQEKHQPKRLRQKTKTGTGFPQPSYIFSKWYCTKGITKVKESFGGGRRFLS
jgi:hypothetical protein